MGRDSADHVAQLGGEGRILGQFDARYPCVWRRCSLQIRRTERSDTPDGRGHLPAGPMRPRACLLKERQLNHAVEQRAGGNGGRLGFLVLSYSRPPPSRMNRTRKHPAVLRNPYVWCPPFFVNKPTLCNKFASIFPLDSPLCLMLWFTGFQ